MYTHELCKSEKAQIMETLSTLKHHLPVPFSGEVVQQKPGVVVDETLHPHLLIFSARPFLPGTKQIQPTKKTYVGS